MRNARRWACSDAAAGTDSGNRSLAPGQPGLSECTICTDKMKDKSKLSTRNQDPFVSDKCDPDICRWSRSFLSSENLFEAFRHSTEGRSLYPPSCVTVNLNVERCVQGTSPHQLCKRDVDFIKGYDSQCTSNREVITSTMYLFIMPLRLDTQSWLWSL